jgi:hypothetical protein
MKKKQRLEIIGGGDAELQILQDGMFTYQTTIWKQNGIILPFLL